MNSMQCCANVYFFSVGIDCCMPFAAFITAVMFVDERLIIFTVLVSAVCHVVI
jgi:hypothetical protein